MKFGVAGKGMGVVVNPLLYLVVGYIYRRRIYREEKAKVVSAIWGTEVFQFLAALAILHQDELENRLIWTLFFNSSWCKYSSKRGKELKQFCPPRNSDDLGLLLCTNPSSIGCNLQN